MTIANITGTNQEVKGLLVVLNKQANKTLFAFPH